ncbi:DUF6841 family protein [Streptomyces chiangmaiensis]|uniref:DUF6841 domain-containing protein n=1 Tax=Streptomyces chiangmaiensis TaxID=766497 RepID=A0ABU7FUJ1_9ACTN|nr:hypothetical protein [Streptomyces chiangmaiensis]MED7827208.1 hypothetical protein [Streptomyces chiangmaiensis]
MAPSSTRLELDETYSEITNWFFGCYLPRWVTAVETSDDASFIGEYWAAPLWVADDSGPVALASTAKEVTAWFKVTFDRLKAAGYTHTVVLDRRAVAFNKHGGAIDVIWSRRRADESEIERLAVHFVIARRSDGLRIVAIEATLTDSGTLDEVWPVHRGEGL